MIEIQYDGMPFGDLNASHRDDIENTYIDITNVLSSKYVQISNLTKAKIVVGRKGSGKTHLLKHINNLSKNKLGYCQYVQLAGDMFSGRGIRGFRGNLEPEEITLLWAEIWRTAFLVSTLSIFYCENPTKNARDAIKAVEGDVYMLKSDDFLNDFQNMIKKTYPELAWSFKYQIDPVIALGEIVKRYTNLNSFNSDLKLKMNFSSLEEDLSRLLHRFGHVHYIIDGLDELAWTDLTGWLDVQRGLFKYVFLSSAVQLKTQYLSTTISIRNYVYERSTQDPHGDRTEAHLIKLNWDKDAATEFLNLRLLRAKDANFFGSDTLLGNRPLAQWLGFETVKPSSRTSPENVEQYLLRHTRLSPRNIVAALNKIAGIKNQTSAKKKILNEVAFREIVSEIARDVSRQMMITTAEELVASVPGIERRLSSQKRASRTQGEYIINMVANELESQIFQVGKEKISRDEFSSLLNNIYEILIRESESEKDKLQAYREIEGIFWRSGLIAYRISANKSWKFSWADGEFGFARPSSAAVEIGFHSSLIDLCGLKVVEDAPIF